MFIKGEKQEMISGLIEFMPTHQFMGIKIMTRLNQVIRLQLNYDSYLRYSCVSVTCVTSL